MRTGAFILKAFGGKFKICSQREVEIRCNFCWVWLSF